MPQKMGNKRPTTTIATTKTKANTKPNIEKMV